MMALCAQNSSRALFNRSSVHVGSMALYQDPSACHGSTTVLISLEEPEVFMLGDVHVLHEHLKICSELVLQLPHCSSSTFYS